MNDQPPELDPIPDLVPVPLVRPRCQGHCCERMVLGRAYSPEQLALAGEFFRRVMLDREELSNEDWRRYMDAGVSLHPDAHVVADMAIPLGEADRDPVWDLAARWPGQQVNQRAHRYNCRHHLPSGDCAIYDHRPQVCRDHGAKFDCDHPACAARPLLPGPVSEDP